MCVGIPMQVVVAGEAFAMCAGRGDCRVIDLRLVGDVPVNTWVLAFQGAAVRVLTPEEAVATNAALDALDAVLAGADNVDAHFADLIERGPVLPDHLKEKC